MSAERGSWLAKHAAGELRSAAEQLQAGEALLSSDEIGEVEIAQRLLLAAMPHEPRCRALAATAYDRLRMLRGEPQKYGTQIVERDGRRELWSVDPSTTDSERAKWDLPPLLELERRPSE